MRSGLTRTATRWIARAKPLVPAKAWPALLALRSATGDRPLIGLPTFRRVVAIAAHPDDESLGCAGTLALLTAAGAAATVAYATDGEATRGSDLPAAEVGALRRREAVAACDHLGITDVRFLGLPDGEVQSHLEILGGYLAELIADSRPDGVLLPWFLDGHPDHEAIAAALSLRPPAADVELWGYETWTPLPANRMVDVTSVIDAKEKAISAHQTAALAFDIGASIGLNRWRSIHGLMGRGYAEAFLAAPAREWLELRTRVMGAT